LTSTKLPELVEGEVIDFAPNSAIWGTIALVWALLAGGAGAFLVVVGLTSSWPKGHFVEIGLLGLLVAGFFAFVGWDILVRSPRLVLGADRMQWAQGKRVVWEIRYENIARVAPFVGPSAAPCVGIQLLIPERLDQGPRLPWLWRWSRSVCKKKFGFDFGFCVGACSEPPERVLETVLTCLHRFQDNAGEGD
jgi:hypothetical protein